MELVPMIQPDILMVMVQMVKIIQTPHIILKTIITIIQPQVQVTVIQLKIIQTIYQKLLGV